MSDPHDTQTDAVVPVEGTALDSSPDGDGVQPGDKQLPEPLRPSDPKDPARSRRAADTRERTGQLQDLVDEPAKVMRIGTMMKQLLDEVKSAPLDDAARARLAEIHQRSLKELEDGLAPELVEELERITLPFPAEGTPSDAELRIAQAQLVGWLEGLFHGIQTALAAKHAAREQAVAQAQLRQLPPGTMIAPGVIIGANGEPQRAAAPAPGAEPSRLPGPADPDHGPGQYL
ncbi:bacterial proteasome activator family protein [Pseudarthrobacter sp. PH31-O2]|uniref:bacterial proteasome activator family protein n=1 Tax=Pseudarthrobacter sp. PH31-O2 TaxID=3046206 RepID=UPI0024BB79AC|nr:bacterial proteasome activator family protein [Pseudarthrobacter sp. PH31-O2]MDJ0353110.1 bacterial proteasome activator family protein [Pseudarthrobacter sp. PH31-O2]